MADDGTPIAYTVRNPDGPEVPLLFANGWSCSDAYWGKLLPLLEAAGHPCILPDTRGHGRSGLPRTPGRGRTEPHHRRPLDAAHRAGPPHRARRCRRARGARGRPLDGRADGARGLPAGARRGPRPRADRRHRREPGQDVLRGRPIFDRLFPIGAGIVRWFPEVLAPVWASIGPASVGHFGARLAQAAGPEGDRRRPPPLPPAPQEHGPGRRRADGRRHAGPQRHRPARRRSRCPRWWWPPAPTCSPPPAARRTSTTRWRAAS